MGAVPHATNELDAMFMGRALELSLRGQGSVEPNPMVGCVIVNDGEVVGEGWHRKFGGPHAEIEALRVAGIRTRGATVYVTLEPCCHRGKTPPCTEALIAGGVARVVCAMADPFAEVSGGGIAALEATGIAVDVGLIESEARRINAPYLKLVTTGRPWVIAKWGMTLDGKIATRTGDSRWISNEASRALVHQLRGRVDAIMVGRGTALHDDPRLLAQTKGLRTAARIVIDSTASLPLDGQLVRTAHEAPVMVAVAGDAPQANIKGLVAAGCEVIECRSGEAVQPDGHRRVDIPSLLEELGRRRMTNVLVEGGGELLGSLFDAGAIDEAHVFIAPKLVGGEKSHSPIAGQGLEKIAASLNVIDLEVSHVGNDLYLRGRVGR